MVLESETVQVEYSMMTCTSKTLKIEVKYKIFVFLSTYLSVFIYKVIFSRLFMELLLTKTVK